MKKRILAMLLSGAMVFSLAACGSGGDGGNDSGSGDGGSSSGEEMNIAMVTDSGDITDQSFNQTTYEASKAWADGVQLLQAGE